MTSPVKPPSLHDLLSTAGDINTMHPAKLRLLCNALVAYAFAAEDAKNEAQAREQQTYLALVKRGPPVPARTISPAEAAKMYPAKRVRSKATTALSRKGRIKRTRTPCPDCGAMLADGGSVGYYCTAPGCDHDTLPGQRTKAKRKVKP